MNRTFLKGSSWVNPCPPYTGIGLLNDTGILYVICDEQFFDPTEQVESPMSPATVALAVTLAVVLSIVLLCAINKRKSYRKVYTLE